MTVWRKWVYPILKTLLVAAIAVALVKLAFFPDRADAEPDALVPTGTIAEPEVPVVRGSIANDVLLTGTVILLLGALGLLTIALVTVRGRIREIGIRRSFGASAGRVFFSVLMETVVGTLFAGVVGVGVSIALVRSPLMGMVLGGAEVQDLPGFPVDAAVIGIASAVAVGALAGLLPAIAAVRVKVIDAIRF